VASGQSNMQVKLNPTMVGFKDIKDTLANPQIRFFDVKREADLTPQTDVTGTWKIAAPDTVVTPDKWAFEGGLSAVGYFFARNLQEKLQRPVAIIESDWGGTIIQAWTSLEALQTLPDTQRAVQGILANRAKETTDPAAHAAALADYEAKSKAWHTDVEPVYRKTILDWQTAANAAKAAGQPIPPRPYPPSLAPQPPFGQSNDYSALFNGMINPLIPFAIRGVIWYQGEQNANGDASNYPTLLKTMITDWRARWAEGDFPFLIVGLANIGTLPPNPDDPSWSWVRDGQAKVAATVPNTALAQAIDLGEVNNIHPRDKRDVGQRLAADALAVAYHQAVPYKGPEFAGMKIEGGKVRISFKNAESGLVIAKPPFTWPGNPVPTTDKLDSFAIAGADQHWVYADAAIDGQDVVVSSPAVPNPVAVRFAWTGNPMMNLYNKDGFPAVPFRTDDWPWQKPAPPAKH